MNRMFAKAAVLVLALTVFCAVASADEYPIGIISLDATGATSGEFDITNLTGANSLPPDLPVTTDLTIAITSLTVNFASGPADVLTAADFTSDGNGGFLGSNSFNLASDPITSAVLVATVTPLTGVAVSGVGTVTLTGATDDGTVPGIAAGSVTVSDPAGPLALGDLAVINAETGATKPPTTTPEPGTATLLGVGFAGIMGLMLMRRRRLPRQGSVQAA